MQCQSALHTAAWSLPTPSLALNLLYMLRDDLQPQQNNVSGKIIQYMTLG